MHPSVIVKISSILLEVGALVVDQPRLPVIPIANISTNEFILSCCIALNLQLRVFKSKLAWPTPTYRWLSTLCPVLGS